MRRDTSMKTMPTKNLLSAGLICGLALTAATTPLQAQERRYDDLANMPFHDGYITKDHVPTVLNELYFERAVQTYLWAMPVLNMYGKKEGSEKVFGSGYNVLPII